jgi:hypothetical protein
MHLVVGSIGFLGFVVTCFVFARRFGELAQPQWKGFSLITGVLFLAAFLGIASGSKGGVSLPFAGSCSRVHLDINGDGSIEARGREPCEKLTCI